MNVIFLDFDGPLFPTKTCLFPENNEDNNFEKRKEIGLNTDIYPIWKMDEFAVVALNRLYTYTPFDIVVSSNWGNGCSRDVVQKLFDANGITVPLAEGKAYRLEPLNLTRMERISDYIAVNRVRNYIMIDDEDSCPDMKNPELVKDARLNPANLFCVDFDNGITLQNFKDMRTLVSSW